jgi:hypothetical protein
MANGKSIALTRAKGGIMRSLILWKYGLSVAVPLARMHTAHKTYGL